MCLQEAQKFVICDLTAYKHNLYLKNCWNKATAKARNKLNIATFMCVCKSMNIKKLRQTMQSISEEQYPRQGFWTLFQRLKRVY